MRTFRSSLQPIFDALIYHGKDTYSKGAGEGVREQWGLYLQKTVRNLTTEGVPARVEAVDDGDSSKASAGSAGSTSKREQVSEQTTEGVPARVEAVEDGDSSKASAGSAVSTSKREQAHTDTPKRKRYRLKGLTRRNSMITGPAWFVLEKLRAAGAAYLVGGSARDLVLKKMPRDFDVITGATPPQIRNKFSRCYIVGKRFPICHVHVGSSIVEVASFGTSAGVAKCKRIFLPQEPNYCRRDDNVRWNDCKKRDFTINGLMYDPFANLLYDYVGGMKDLRKAKVRTITPAHTSFEEDPARILRAFRVAGRLRFTFATDTDCAIHHLAHSILRLDRQRLLMEMNYIFAYGAAEASLRLLARFQVLKILLPFQAAYFSSKGSLPPLLKAAYFSSRCSKVRDERYGKQSNMLLALFANLDKLLASDRPCHSSLWVGLLAFHLALVNKPRDVLLVTAFSFSLYYGECSAKAISAARNTVQRANRFRPEIVKSIRVECDNVLLKEVFNLASGAIAALDSMVNTKSSSQATSENPQVPFSDPVFISKSLYVKVAKIFGIAGVKEKHNCHQRECLEINYSLLGHGDLEEVQFVFAKVVLGTLYSDFKDPLN